MDACQPPDDLHPRCEDAFAKVRMYAVQPPERAARRAAPQARFGQSSLQPAALDYLDCDGFNVRCNLAQKLPLLTP